MPTPIAGGRTRLRSWIGLLAGALTLRWRRFEIADNSMRPALQDGDWVLGLAGYDDVREGDVVVCDLPGRPGFEIVKRVSAIDPGDRALLLLGDDPESGSVDGRSFGWLPAEAVTARLVLRYRPLPPRFVRQYRGK